ncbi:cytohesin-interacting protein-like isoform X1 [Sinocyclocheilus anshuiensis]|uniref:cytohesin-interacting protein-like isoform X1 n=1 Tax=Sinocyclocheilus anshuiensis TaxID=1608454 RepID=UPI0007BA13CA|nr:PREDICTED: cytohesin-interacting protein-like isoform X1 [Sinocyclocheilus anshuiensis]
MTASVQYIRKLLGKSSCATSNLLNTGHKTQKNTTDSKTIRNKDGKSHKRNVVQFQDNTTEQYIRKSVVLRRKENETFGFDIQTSSVERSISTEQDLGSCVCWVKENSLAESSGLMTGDVIITVNSVYIAGFTQQQINNLVQKSSTLMMEIIRGSTEKQRQLLSKRYLLQKQFTEKCEELQTLIAEEVRLAGGAVENIQKLNVLPAESSANLC